MRKLTFGTIQGVDHKKELITIESDDFVEESSGKVAIIRCDNIIEESKIEEFVKSLNQ